jgi:O-antigen ligase
MTDPTSRFSERQLGFSSPVMSGAQASLAPVASRRRAAIARVRTSVFLLAVIAINYTWSRPSPVDILFFGALLLTVFSQQTLNIRSFLFICIILIWLASVYISSLALVDEPSVVFEMFALTSVAGIGITSCLVATGWREPQLRTFVSVYILANVIAALIGIFGFVVKNPDLTWAERPRAFLDDPDMLGAFLVPGVLCTLYMISENRRRVLYGMAFLLLCIAVCLTFSRAAIVSALIWGGIYYLFLNRHNMLRAILYALGVFAILAGILLIFYFSNDTYSDMLSGRLTLAEDYDTGHFGRYNRYFLAMPLILEHPFGLGLEQVDKYFPEPIHNVWIASFLYFGWIGGLAWTLLLLLSIQQAWSIWRRTRNEVVLLILFGWASIISCSMLHEGERWRFMWLFTGVLWGLNARNLTATSDRIVAADSSGPIRDASV